MSRAFRLLFVRRALRLHSDMVMSLHLMIEQDRKQHPYDYAWPVLFLNVH